MDKETSSASNNILPAQLLHQKLLNCQQNVDDTSENNDDINSLPISNPRFLNGRLSLLESSLDMHDDSGIEKDDDDDVTIPGKTFIFTVNWYFCRNVISSCTHSINSDPTGQLGKLSLQNSMKNPTRNLSLTSPVLLGSKMSPQLIGSSKPGINNGQFSGNELPSLNDRAVIVR